MEVSPIHSHGLPTVLSPTTPVAPRGLSQLSAPAWLSVQDRFPSASITAQASPLTRRLASYTGRIEFLSYGPVVRLPLLPTPSLDDAVTVGYSQRALDWKGLSPSHPCALSGARAPASRRLSGRRPAAIAESARVRTRADYGENSSLPNSHRSAPPSILRGGGTPPAQPARRRRSVRQWSCLRWFRAAPNAARCGSSSRPYRERSLTDDRG
jgi:hypothetical protein